MMGRRQIGIKWGVSLPFLPLFIFLPSIAAPDIVQGTCEFPEAWKGSYFQSDNNEIIKIENNTIHPKGICVDSHNDKHLIYDERLHCYQCLVIYESHINVLQYKESYCFEYKKMRPSLQEICDEIHGDAELLSLFRLNPVFESCPLNGVFDFTYTRNGHECSSRLSHVETCSTKSKLLFQYEACPDVPASESKNEEIECFAKWKGGSQCDWYFIARVRESGKKSSDHSENLEDTTRCFCYKKFEDSHKLAISGRATCAEISSTHDAHEALILTQKSEEIPQCDFPSWLEGKWRGIGSESDTHLHLLDPHTFKVKNETEEMEIKCMNRTDHISGDKSTIIMTKIHGCEKKSICMIFYKRSKWVVEFEECYIDEFPNDASSSLITTLVSESRTEEVEPCVLNGVFNALNPCLNASDVNLVFSSGCDSPTTIHFNFDLFCNEFEINSSLDCIGSWTEKESGTFLVASSKGYFEKNVCFHLDLRRNLFASNGGCERRPSQTSLPFFFKSDCSETSVESFTSTSGEIKGPFHYFSLFMLLLSFFTSLL